MKKLQPSSFFPVIIMVAFLLMLPVGTLFAGNVGERWVASIKVLSPEPCSEVGGRLLSLKMPCKLLSGITERDYSIYLPPDYEEASSKTYPVLYLLHGGGGAHTDWERNHHISQMLDSLIAAGIIKDMIVVMAEGNQQNMMYFNAGDREVKGVKGVKEVKGVKGVKEAMG